MPTHTLHHQLINSSYTHSQHRTAPFSSSSFSSFVVIFLVIHGSHSRIYIDVQLRTRWIGWTMNECGLCVIAITISICFFLLLFVCFIHCFARIVTIEDLFMVGGQMCATCVTHPFIAIVYCCLFFFLLSTKKLWLIFLGILRCNYTH